jgi:hypothetical protein
MKTSVRIGGVLAKIWIEDLQNLSVEPYRYSNLFSDEIKLYGMIQYNELML